MRLGACLALIAIGGWLLGPTAAGATVMELSGNEWQQLGEIAQDFYIIGVVEGAAAMLLYVARIEADKQPATTIGAGLTYELLKCVNRPGVSRAQYLAIVRKYVRDHPADWHYTMPSLIFNALATCPP